MSVKNEYVFQQWHENNPKWRHQEVVKGFGVADFGHAGVDSAVQENGGQDCSNTEKYENK